MSAAILEEHCSRCNEPIFKGQGRYRITNSPIESLCEKCGDERFYRTGIEEL